ncbi:MAG TPA: chemotaxis protein, partial [Gammaproteobacteria bacterium]|nr:chemotaxis protein [Gammaproteobacteria bacterium]
MSTSCLLIALGVTVLLGWYLNIPFLVQVFPSFAPMQANTALGFLLTGGGLFAMSREWLKGSIISGILLIVLGTLTLSQYLFNINLGIDEILVEQSSIMQNV